MPPPRREITILTKAATESPLRLQPVTLINQTQSLCPECLAILEAEVYEQAGKIWIRKNCSKHGEFNELYWGSSAIYERAKRYARDGKGVDNPSVSKQNPVCPIDCGLCNLHTSHTALGNIVLTNRCDLNCWYCFFFAEKAGYVYEPSLDQIRSMVRSLTNEKPVPCNAIQLTGGEPTLREDLLDIIKICREEGIDHVQLNTDGINLSRDPTLAAKVREAGVNTIYLSYDGTTLEKNPKNHKEIPGVLDNCKKAGVGVVLVPTVIKGTNDSDVGSILRFALKNLDSVRGVNFQPISIVGRVPERERERFRITIPDVMMKIEEDFAGEISRDDFYPIPSCMPFSNFVEALTHDREYELSTHFACGMATYVFRDGEKTIPMPRFVDVDGFFGYLDEKAVDLRKGSSKYAVGLKLLYRLFTKFVDKSKAPKGLNVSRILFDALLKHDYRALGVLQHNSLFIGMMHFQDLYNWDIERAKRCAIHYATPDERIIPFCTFNVIPEWYRDKVQREYGMPIGEWEKKTGRKLSDDLYRRIVSSEPLKAPQAS
jgi:uncharacterized radical SAM superfamily Fe-S cluster-containing enzyme